MSETLLFLHVLSAAALVTSVVAFSAVALGARMEPGAFRAFYLTWNISAAAVLIFGIWLAIDIDVYEVWDGWVLLAVGLWAAAGFTGEALPKAFRQGGAGASIGPAAVRMHWITTILIVLLLADMVWKPWA